MPDRVGDEFRQEEAGENEGRVQHAGRDHAHALGMVQAALQSTEALEGVEGEEEGDADEYDVLHDASFFRRRVRSAR